ncbi:MAG TPA: SDR family NAD(P)-dependent oxidoreductase [Polyangiaceae bacterium]
MKKLENKVAVVTGGTSGIGLASARLFLEEGAHVVVFARGESGLLSARQALGTAVHCVRGYVLRTVEPSSETLFTRPRRRRAALGNCFGQSPTN